MIVTLYFIIYLNLINSLADYNSQDIIFEVISDGLNSLIFDDSYVKICFLVMILSKYDKITFIDFDTIFSAYYNAGIIKKEFKSKNIDIFLPDEYEFVSLINKIIKSINGSSILVLDSINSFYNMYYKKLSQNQDMRVSEIQRIFSNFTMLLVKYCNESNIPIVVTSFMSYKKEKEWILTIPNKRLTQKKSNVLSYIGENENKGMYVNVMSHPVFGPKTIPFKYDLSLSRIE